MAMTKDPWGVLSLSSSPFASRPWVYEIEPVELVMNVDPIMMDTKTWESRPSRLENRTELVNRTLQSEQFRTAPEKCHKKATAARHNRGPKKGGASQTSSHDNLKAMLVKWLENISAWTHAGIVNRTLFGKLGSVNALWCFLDTSTLQLDRSSGY